MADTNSSHRSSRWSRWAAICAVAAVATAGASIVDATNVVSVQADTEAPGAPPGFDVAFAVGNRVTLIWGRSTDDTGIAEYQILRNGELLTSVPGSDLQVLLDDLPHGGSWLQVRAVDWAGNTSVRSAPVVFFADRRPPPAPVVVSAVYDSTRNDVLLTFSATDVATEATSYRIYENGRRILTTGPAGAVDIVGDQVSLRLDAVPGPRYFQVDETDAAGNTSVRSSPLMVAVPQPDRRPPSAPRNVTASIVDQSIEVSWDASRDDVGVASYRLLINGESIGSPVETTSARLGPVDKPTLWIQVVATDTSGKESVRSAPFRLETAN